jgi:hypothetical protein
MGDTEIIEYIAKLWVELGGDSEGFLWTERKIYEKIKELEEEPEK